jgi:hypothetical protein
MMMNHKSGMGINKNKEGQVYNFNHGEKMFE